MRQRIRTALVCLAVPLALAGCSDGVEEPATPSSSTATSETVMTSEAAVSSEPYAPQPNPTPGEAVPEPEPDPQPVPEPDVPQVTGPQLGDQCIGADIGRTAVAADGTAIMCDNYVWQLNQGQTATHPWADGQREWAECIADNTTEQCREMLND